MINIIKRVEVWGDSVLKGVIYDEIRKKYRRLENSHLMKKITGLGVDVKNNSKFGMTAPKAKTYVKGFGKGIDAEAAIIEFGEMTVILIGLKWLQHPIRNTHQIHLFLSLKNVLLIWCRLSGNMV